MVDVDKLYNSRAHPAWDVRFATDRCAVWDRFGRERDCVLWYYRSLVDAFRLRRTKDERTARLRELDATVTELEALSGGPRPGRPDEGDS